MLATQHRGADETDRDDAGYPRQNLRNESPVKGSSGYPSANDEQPLDEALVGRGTDRPKAIDRARYGGYEKLIYKANDVGVSVALFGSR